MNIYGIEKGSYYLIKVGDTLNIENIPNMREVIDLAMDIGHKSIVLDVSECSNISFSALGLIANLYKRCSRMGGEVGLLNPSPLMRDIISSSKLSSLVSVFQSEKVLETVF
jgi:anti-anti-sigma factor